MIKERQLKSFVHDSLLMETWWLRYYSLLHATVVLAVPIWICALLPLRVPAGLKIFALSIWPLAVLACIFAAIQHERVSARVRVQYPPPPASGT